MHMDLDLRRQDARHQSHDIERMMTNAKRASAFLKALAHESRLIILCVLLSTAAAAWEQARISAGNALLVIEPYRTGSNSWAFDEPRLGLHREPFVQGIPQIIDRAVAWLPGSDKSVRLTFSQQAFPGAQLRLDRRQEQDGGNWYHCAEYNMDGWLCPALFKFFPRAPAHLYVKAEAL